MTTQRTERLTDEQIKATVAAMNTSDALKAAILKQALSGDASARFAVYGAYLRQNGLR